MIHSLIKKPQAFRYSQIRDDLLPTTQYKEIWKYVDENFPGKEACKLMVGLLYLAAKHDCEKELSEVVLSRIQQNQRLSLLDLQRRYETDSCRSTHYYGNSTTAKRLQCVVATTCRGGELCLKQKHFRYC